MAGGLPPLEVEMYYAIQKFGAASVTGRPLGVYEVRLMSYIGKTITEYRKQANSNG